MRLLALHLSRAAATLLGVVTLLFLLFGLLGDPAEQIAGQRADVATLENIRTELGLDQPLWQQYLGYLNDLSPLAYLSEAARQTGNYRYLPLVGGLVLKAPYLRHSYQSGRPILALYLERLPGTALLALTALAFAALVGIGLGTLAGTRPGSWWDRALGLVSLVGISAPSFFVAILAIWVFSASLGWLPSSGYVREPDLFSMGYHWQGRLLILPALTLGIRPLAILFQISRDSMIETLRQPYIRTARAKGLSPMRVVLRHALPNSLNPVLTSLTGWLASLLAGTFFIEYIFHWQGIGKLTIDALLTNDYPLLLGSALCTSVLFIAINEGVDVLYTRLDPRIRLRK
ncbi:MAG: ABC transporter permease [Bacteroidetes bacterium]|jgi:peptide/nickel transport system permease protein|nr:ABC transporter permease [Bacteroidota bacterium]